MLTNVLSKDPWKGVHRVILTSTGMHRSMSCTALQTEFERLCPRADPRSARVVYDITAYVHDESKASVDGNDLVKRRSAGVNQAWAFAKDYGINLMDVFDLSAPEFDEGHYAEAVRKADVYYADIGNTWAALHWLKARGAVNPISGLAERVKRGELLYVGSSAGSICGGKTAETATWKNWDDMWEWQKLLPEHSRTDWNVPGSRSGLDIAGGISLFPHYEMKWAEVCETRQTELDHDVVCCADGHGCVIVDGKHRLVSPEGCPPHVPLRPGLRT